jgi:hypothetical protein
MSEGGKKIKIKFYFLTIYSLSKMGKLKYLSSDKMSENKIKIKIYSGIKINFVLKLAQIHGFCHVLPALEHRKMMSRRVE